MWLNMHINVAKTFHLNYHVKVMHIDRNHDLLMMIYQT